MKKLALGTTMLCLFTAAPAWAQNSVDTITDEIIVTATKKASGENVQEVAIAMTALGAKQLDALQIRDIAGLGFKMPNVALDDIATARGTANFSIRGLGVNSSIPSIDPAVGVFVDGMYLGVNAGVIFDTFDLESIEVLRGPQGVLFGKNVTGGAVLINTADPAFKFGAQAKFAVESGLRHTGTNYYSMGSITGPLVGDKLAGKLAVYYNKDNGWFKNTLTNVTVGKAKTFIIRPALRFSAGQGLDINLKFEHGATSGDGPVGQSHTNGSGVDGQIVNFDRHSFDNANDEPGLTDAKWNQFIAKAQFDVGFGNGKVTNIFAWREFTQAGTSDIDSTPRRLFHADFATDQNQISNEIRYNGSFNDFDVTSGLFYFKQNLAYDEVRNLLGVLVPPSNPGFIRQFGGGRQDHKTLGVFTNVDWHLNDKATLSAGLRFTDENKDVQIASLFRNLVHPAIPNSANTAPCSVIAGTCPYDFPGPNDNGNFSTSNWSPSLVAKWKAGDTTNFYGSWKRAFRAGGYNFRNTSPLASPGPFGDERADTFELGFKSKWAGLGRLNGAVYRTNLSNMQREVNTSNNVSAVVQDIRNTGSAEILGLELDGQLIVSDNLLLDASLGLQNGDYTDLIFDISSDGVIDDKDLALDIPRLAPVTATIGFVYDHELSGLGALTAQASYAYRAESAYTDSNRGVLNAGNRVDAALALRLDAYPATLRLYGKNLTNNVQHGNDTQLPARLGPVPLGGTFAPLAKGRVIGIELQIDY